MNPWTALGLVAIAGVLLYVWWTRTTEETKTGEIVLLNGSHPGKIRKSISLVIPRSFNQPEGLIFSYACWVLVKDFQAGYGTERKIFSKNNAPGLYLDPTSNSLLVKLTTFEGPETLVVPNIPAMKWVHIALTVDQDAVDVYVNGTLREHRGLSRLPRQNEDAITIGPNWDGVIARLSYWPRALSGTEVLGLSRLPAPDDLMAKPAPPQYFDLTWYIGRLYSTE